MTQAYTEREIWLGNSFSSAPRFSVAQHTNSTSKLLSSGKKHLSSALSRRIFYASWRPGSSESIDIFNRYGFKCSDSAERVEHLGVGAELLLTSKCASLALNHFRLGWLHKNSVFYVRDAQHNDKLTSPSYSTLSSWRQASTLGRDSRLYHRASFPECDPSYIFNFYLGGALSILASDLTSIKFVSSGSLRPLFSDPCEAAE